MFYTDMHVALVFLTMSLMESNATKILEFECDI